MSGLILILVCVLLSAAASIFLKSGAVNISESMGFYDLVTNQMILMGGLFYAFSFLAYILALRFMPLSLVQPVITAGVSAITVISAAIIFHETLSVANWIGLVTICVGIFLLFCGRI